MEYRFGKGRNSPLPGEGKFSVGSGKQIQIGTGKHGIQTVLILPESAVHGFSIPKLTFDDSENMLHLAAYGGLEILDMSFPANRPVGYAREGTGTAVDPVINAGKMWVTGHFGPLLNPQIGGISIHEFVVLAEQMGRSGDIVDIYGGDRYGMYQTTAFRRFWGDKRQSPFQLPVKAPAPIPLNRPHCGWK